MGIDESYAIFMRVTNGFMSFGRGKPKTTQT